jgi:hypothetical protein
MPLALKRRRAAPVRPFDDRAVRPLRAGTAIARSGWGSRGDAFPRPASWTGIGDSSGSADVMLVVMVSRERLHPRQSHASLPGPPVSASPLLGAECEHREGSHESDQHRRAS